MYTNNIGFIWSLHHAVTSCWKCGHNFGHPYTYNTYFYFSVCVYVSDDVSVDMVLRCVCACAGCIIIRFIDAGTDIRFKPNRCNQVHTGVTVCACVNVQFVCVQCVCWYNIFVILCAHIYVWVAFACMCGGLIYAMICLLNSDTDDDNDAIHTCVTQAVKSPSVWQSILVILTCASTMMRAACTMMQSHCIMATMRVKSPKSIHTWTRTWTGTITETA